MSDLDPTQTDPDGRLTEAVRSYASPVPGSSDRAGEMLAAVERERGRRRGTAVPLLVAASVVVAASVGIAAWVPDTQSPGDRHVTHQGQTGGTWKPMAESPLSPRHASLGVWTGDELVVVGGRTGFVCPPNADCTGDGEPNAEAAAYDPDADSWRTLPDLPVPVAAAEAEDQVGDLIAWDGDEVVVVRGDTTYTLDPGAGSTLEWGERPVDTLPGQAVPGQTVADGNARLLVHAAYDSPGGGSERIDWMLNPATGHRTFFPTDPFGESYDRSIGFDGERFWLLSMDVEHHFAAYEGAPSRLAVLDDGQWRVVDDETPEMVYGQRLHWDGDRLVVPPTDVESGYWFDPDTETWGTIGAPDRLASPKAGSCPVPAAGVGPRWISGIQGVLVHGDVALSVPDCAKVLDAPAVAVWADDELLVWGGAGPDGDKRYQVSAAGLRWTPPTP